MKRNSLYKGLVISVALSAVLAGCGSTSVANSDNSSSTQNDTTQAKIVQGKAVDGYLQYATVCLDLNQDGYCQSTEPMSTTEADGSFKLEISEQIQESKNFDEAMLLVYGGKDVDTGTDFVGKLLAPYDGNISNITPITTIIAKAVQEEVKNSDKELTKKEILEKVKAKKEKLAEVFGLDVADLMKDPVAHKQNNPKLIKEALKIQKAIEAVESKKSDMNKDALEQVYAKLAQNIDQVEDVNDLMNRTFTSEEDKKIAQAISANIDMSFEKFDGDLAKVAHITKEDIRKIKKGDSNITRANDDDIFDANVDWDKEYIKSELEDIGVQNPSDIDIEKIKDTFQGQIKPGILDKIQDEISKDDSLKEIHDKLQVIKAQKQREKEVEKEKYNPSKRVDLKDIFSSKTLYTIEDSQVTGFAFNEDVTSALIGDNEKISVKIEGNTIWGGSDKRDLLIYKTQTSDYYEFSTPKGETVRFFKDESSAQSFLEEMDTKDSVGGVNDTFK